MQKTKRLAISVLLAAVFLFTAFFACFAAACDNSEVINEYEYTAGNFWYTENLGLHRVYDVNVATTENATFYFEETMSAEKCNRFITYADLLLDRIKTDSDFFATSLGEPWTEIDGLASADDLERIESGTKQWGQLRVFVSGVVETPRADHEKGTVCFQYDDLKSVELIAYTLQALNTNTLNYGLVYGVSSTLFQQLGWGKTPKIKDSKIKEFLDSDENRFVLDLTYPVFHKKFSTAEQTEYAKGISVNLVDYIKKTHGESAIGQLFEADKAFDLAFDNLFCGYVNEWLDTLQIERVEPSTEVLKWVSHSRDFPFKLLTYSCEYIFNNDWEEPSIKDKSFNAEYLGIGFSYAEIKDFLAQSESGLASVREFFGYDESDYASYKRVPCTVENMDIYSGLANENYFYLSSLTSLVHEYAHVASIYKCGKPWSWMTEPIAEYCAAAFSDRSHKLYFAIYNDVEGFERREGEIGELAKYVMQNLMDKSENPNFYLRFLEGQFYTLFFERGVNLHSVFSKYLNDYNRTFGLIFGDFLVNTYGGEKFVELYANSGDLYKTYGISLDALIDEYLAYLYDVFNL